MHERVFEPRVTSKLDTMVMDRWGVHGRGMALFSVRSNVTEARVVASDLHKGSAVTVVSTARELPERADQSTVAGRGAGRGRRASRRARPSQHRPPRGGVRVRAPRGRRVPRLPGGDLATLHAIARESLDVSDLLFCDDLSRLPVWQRPAAAADAAELTEVAASIGLAVSERTAHRVLAGELVARGDRRASRVRRRGAARARPAGHLPRPQGPEAPPHGPRRSSGRSSSAPSTRSPSATTCT